MDSSDAERNAEIRVDAGFDAHLDADGVAFDADDVTLLRTIDEHGSLNKAADALGRSYSRAHERLTVLEEALGPLVSRERGGAGGGGSELTANARDILTRFERLRVEFTGTAEAEETVLGGSVLDRDGEIARVETDAGTVRALVPVGVTDVELNIRADAVTLHASDDAPNEDATSARNRFRGTVVRVDRGTAIAHVAVDVGATDPLVALVTMASVEKLDLEPGREVVASFKATATRGLAQER